MQYLTSRAFSLSLLLVIELFTLVVHAHAERLPIRTYTSADGLAQDNVSRIVCDSRGFLWFCTAEGLSRFDGYQFSTYTTDNGLPDRRVNDLLETRAGTYWVATDDGVCRFNPTGSPLFDVFYPGEKGARMVEAMIEDRDGAIWCATHRGLYRMEPSGASPRFQSEEMGMSAEGDGSYIQALLIDRQGSLWVGTRGAGLYRRRPDGRIEHYTSRDGLACDRVEALLQDRNGRLWVGTTSGLTEFSFTAPEQVLKFERLLTTPDGLGSNWIESLFQASDGTLWISADSGLTEFIEPERNGRQFRNYTTANGLSSHYILGLAEDREGNLWLGSDSGGAMKLVRGGLTSFSEADGLAAAGVDAIIEDRSGQLYVISSGTRHFINRFDGRRFTSVWPNFPAGVTNFGWGWNQTTFQDRSGQWWVPTGQGLCRFPAVGFDQLGHTRPSIVYTTRNGLPFNDVFRLYEDSHGDVWISALSSETNGLARWERSTEELQTFSYPFGAPLGKQLAVAAFGEDYSGNLWIGLWVHGLIRRSAAGFTFFSEADGLPAGTIRSIYLDHAHRIWIASALGGLARIDDPSAEHPHFVVYTTAQGLSSNDIWCMTEDQWGRIYVGTGRGLDRLDPETGHVRHYSTADGLMEGKVTTAFRDHTGALWFGSNVHGLSRLVPIPDPPHAAPPILIRSLRIAGVSYPLSQLGALDVPAINLGSGQNQLNISFVGLSFGPGERLRYQYKLEGADRDWSAPGEQRDVNYANLAPGHYLFLVRAVNNEGQTSPEPATITFTILPPIWRRWWFLGIAALLGGLAIFTAHRARVARLIELERIRTRIATDLHDDIGANLSLIAMLSEVAPGRVQHDDPKMSEWFATIAATSRDTVDAMSDIVWAVNPRRDSFKDLVQRMRRFSDDIFGARDVELHFSASDPGRDIKIGADVRREVFLVFKESINNIVRHSRCTKASVDLHLERGWLVLNVSDNGNGFDVDGTNDGNGLASMRQRAKKLSGKLEIISALGRGCCVSLRIPLKQRAKI